MTCLPCPNPAELCPDLSVQPKTLTWLTSKIYERWSISNMFTPFCMIVWYEVREIDCTLTNKVNLSVVACCLQQKSVLLRFVTARRRHSSTARSVSGAWWIGCPQWRWQVGTNNTAIINHTRNRPALILHATSVKWDGCRTGGKKRCKNLHLLSFSNLCGCNRWLSKTRPFV